LKTEDLVAPVLTSGISPKCRYWDSQASPPAQPFTLALLIRSVGVFPDGSCNRIIS